ncbi:MAG: transporter [Thermodesulfovibrionales bacterium]
MRIKVLFIFLFAFSLIFSVSPVWAYHPLITDDTGTQGEGRWQYDFNVEYGYDKDKGIKTKELSLNNTLTYGLTDNLDIGIGIPYVYWKEEDHESIDESGFSDIELGLKYRFYETKGLNVAIKPSITIPSGDEERGLGTGRVTGRFFLILDREFRDLTFFFNAGYIRNENRIDERKNLWHLSLAGEYRIKEGFKVVGNIGMEKDPDRTSHKNPAFLIIGTVYTFSDAFDLSAGIKRGLTEPETDTSLMAGITLRF